jgi:hypothetical protein
MQAALQRKEHQLAEGHDFQVELRLPACRQQHIGHEQKFNKEDVAG